MVNIILEGCDCVGKTSIAKILNKNNKYKIEHCSNPSSYEDGKEQYYNIVKKLNKSNNLIYDRSMLSETVYAPIFRNYYPTYMRGLEKELNNNTYMFLITADIEEIEKRFDGKFITINQIGKIQSDFKDELDKSNYKNKYIIDTSNITPEEAANKINEIISDMHE